MEATHIDRRHMYMPAHDDNNKTNCISKDSVQCVACSSSESMTIGRSSGPSLSAASSNRGSQIRRSRILFCLTAAVVLTMCITQVRAAPGPSRPGSSHKASRFYRAGFSPNRLHRSTGSSSSKYHSPYTSSSSSLPSSFSKSSVDLNGQPPTSRSSKSSATKSEPDALARLSKVFGISRIPHQAIQRSPPQYMQELYASTTDTGGLTRARGPYNSNTIRSFPDKGWSQYKEITVCISIRKLFFPI